jgi:MFS transporter, ENTS family, enterobactin (siderophore) exporter
MATSDNAGSVPILRFAARVAAAAGCAALVTLAVWTVAVSTGASAGETWGGNYANVRGLASWLVASISEPQFYAVAPASCGLLLGGMFAYLARRRSRRWAGFVQACGTGIWPWVAGSALASLFLGILAWGWTLRPGLWQPLFVPLVAVAPAMVVLYGPTLRVCLTAAVSGAVLTPPAAILAVDYVCTPGHLPPVVGATTGMWTAAFAAFWSCRFLPWMPAPGAWRAAQVVEDHARASRATTSLPWVLRRALADFSEAQFFGNEWASAAMLFGAVAAYLASPAKLAYGTGLFLAVLASQTVTALAGVLIWRRRWQELGFYPTFVPVVSVAPATVLAFGGTPQSVIAGALAGALIAPPAAAAISRRLPAHFHPFIGNVASMTVSTAVIVSFLHLIPGVAA